LSNKYRRLQICCILRLEKSQFRFTVKVPTSVEMMYKRTNPISENRNAKIRANFSNSYFARR
jgi:hypothetical protein